MPATPRQHFNQDIARASSIITHAAGLPAAPAAVAVRDDILRSAWMLAVGAMDAYFCDAYVAVVVLTLRAKSIQASVDVPPFIRSIRLPIGSMLAAYANRPNWRWRMAVRQMMERDSVLSLTRIRDLFNPFFRTGHKFFIDQIDTWINRPNATAHLFGITAANYGLTVGAARQTARKAANAHLMTRLNALIQRRHDCIHNCDRPRNALQAIGAPGSIRNVLRDVRFLVANADDHIEDEFERFLHRIGCNAVTRNAVGY